MPKTRIANLAVAFAVAFERRRLDFKPHRGKSQTKRQISNFEPWAGKEETGAEEETTITGLAQPSIIPVLKPINPFGNLRPPPAYVCAISHRYR